MERVYWVRRDGSEASAEVSVDLGSSSGRWYPRRGPRRMLWDFCFGYVSGYPVRDILAFVWHHGVNDRIERRWVERRRQIMARSIREATRDV